MPRRRYDELVERIGLLHCSFRRLHVDDAWTARIEGTLYPEWGTSPLPAARSIAVVAEEPAVPFTVHARGVRTIRVDRWDDEAEWRVVDDDVVLLPYGSWQSVTLHEATPVVLTKVRDLIAGFGCADDEVMGAARWLDAAARDGATERPALTLTLPEPIMARVLSVLAEGAPSGATVLPNTPTDPRAPGTRALLFDHGYVVATEFEFDLETDPPPTAGR